MTTLDPCLSPDELRVYVACVQLHDAGRPVTITALQLALIDMTIGAITRALVTLNCDGLIRTLYAPLYRVELDRDIVRREVGR